MKEISSLQNELIKNIIRLNKAGERKKQNLFVIEGYREISLGLNAGFEIETLLFCISFLRDKSIDELVGSRNINVIEVLEAVYSKIAYRESFDGVIAIAKYKNKTLADIKLSACPLVIVLETVEKPGNLGAILRTADAAGVDAVVICDNQTDIYNPNAIRASLGSVFTNQVVCCSNEEALEWLRNNKISTFATSLKGTKFHHDCRFSLPSAILMGSEAYGLSDFWYKNADELIKIPMNGKVDSLNVSVSTAIVVFEALRQRQLIINS